MFVNATHRNTSCAVRVAAVALPQPCSSLTVCTATLTRLQDNVYKSMVAGLASEVETAVKQNNTMDMYEEYFEDYSLDLSSAPPSAKGLAVFRDPCAMKRTATSVNWHPEGNKIAGMCVMQQTAKCALLLFWHTRAHPCVVLTHVCMWRTRRRVPPHTYT